MSTKRKVAVLKTITVALGAIFVGSLTVSAQPPILSQAAGKVGFDGGFAGTASNFEFYMDPVGFPRAVTAGETIFMMGSWPNGNNPSMSDDKSNTWASVTNCLDGTGIRHGFFYAVNAAANTSAITETHGSNVANTVFDWAHFYNMSTTASGFVDGSSCRTGVAPANNTAPNISGTGYTTTTNGDLILVCVYVENNPLGHPNPISSVTWPAGFFGLSEDIWYGHACAYGVQTTAGSFTPTFTFAQGTHNAFTIISAAFKAGTGGSVPPAGASIVLSEMHMENAAGQTETVYLPCPSGTTNVTIADELGFLNSVSDNNSNTWSHTAPQSGYANFYYVNNPTITASTYRVTMTFSSVGGYSLVGLFCNTNTSGVDTAATARNGSTLDGVGSGTTYNFAPSWSNPYVDAPSIGTSVAGDLVLSAGTAGVGPIASCVTGHCVYDYVGSTNWVNGDNQSYSNGDFMAHQYVSAAGTINFEYNTPQASTGFTAMAIAFKPASSGQGPAPPTGLTTTVH